MFAACHSTRCRAKESRDGEFRVACKGVKHREIRLYARQGLAGGSGGHSGTLNLIERARRFATPVPFQTMKRWKIVRAGGAPRMLAACPRRARIQGSQTFVSLNSRLESNKEERRRTIARRTPKPAATRVILRVQLCYIKGGIRYFSLDIAIA